MTGEPLLTKGIPPDPLPKTFKLNCIGEYCPFGRQLRIFVALADIGFTSEFDARTKLFSRWKTERRSVFADMVNKRADLV